MSNRSFNFKAFISFLLMAAFLVSVISGIMLYVAPPGRIANWTNWQILGLSKTQWTSFHIVFATLFIVTGIFHIFYFNWKLLWSYINRKTKRGIYYRKEFFIALVIFIILAIGTWAKIPPIISVVDLGDYITDSWEVKEDQPPEAHAELFTIREFSDKIGQPLETVMNTLISKSYIPDGAEQTLENLAQKHNLAPIDIYNLFKEKTEDAETVPTGSGYGRMKLDKLAEELGMSIDDAKANLSSAGITKVNTHETLREIADANDRTPAEVFNALSSK